MAQSMYAKRLEIVRSLVERESLQDFVSAVNQEAAESFPYATVRRYHNEDREPSPAYLLCVSKRFGVRLEWLMAGEEPVFESQVAREEDASTPGVRGDIPVLASLPYSVTHAVSRHLDRVREARPVQPVDASPSKEDPDPYETELWHWLMGPFDGATKARPLDWARFEDYVNAALHARNLALGIPTTSLDEDPEENDDDE